MGIPKPLTIDEVSGETQEILTNIKQGFGRIPNFLGVMARSPEALKLFLPLANAILKEGKLEAKYRELAFLKASYVNACSN